MRASVRETLIFVQMEALRLSRTDEVYRYLLLPSLLGIPVLLFGVVEALSIQGPAATVAVPSTLPPELDVTAALEARNVQVFPEADPQAAWAAGRVDGAVVTVEDAAGIGGARGIEHAERERWRVSLVADDLQVRGLLVDAVDDAAGDWLDDIVSLAGGDPGPTLDVVDLDVLAAPRADDAPIDLARAIPAYCVGMIGLMGFYFLALPAVADRSEGVTETLRALPVSIRSLLWGRLGAMLVLQAAAALLVSANVLLLLANVLGNAGVGGLHLADVAGWGAAVVLIDAVYVAVGAISATAKTANNTSAVAMLAQYAILALGVFRKPPAWVPLAGVFVAHNAVDRVVAVVACLVPAALLLALVGRQVERRVELVLRRGDE